ncbi:MAG: GNAT family N-acetyltransferase [Lachnospiraceae bacterium]|nr:GNAT family N-acetyltransferase [Lachnospiraceae bacterium]
MGRLRFPLVSDRLLLQPGEEKDIWKTKWTIRLKEDDKKSIGTMQFEGSAELGEVTVFVELLPEYRNQGYGSEIFYYMSEFVFRFRGIREILACCDHENDSCIHALDKAGFVFREHKDRKDYYSKKRPKTVWTGFYVFIGIFAGFLIGIVLSNLWLGTALGVLTGVVLGILMDRKENL